MALLRLVRLFKGTPGIPDASRPAERISLDVGLASADIKLENSCHLRLGLAVKAWNRCRHLIITAKLGWAAQIQTLRPERQVEETVEVIRVGDSVPQYPNGAHLARGQLHVFARLQ
jgi:hypothetical protein